MKTLGLLRHAKSDHEDRALRDFDRGLNDRGRRGAAVMGEHIRAHGLAWDRLIASPAERVRRTVAAARLTLPTTWDQRLYLADSSALIDVLRELDDGADAILLAGHNPGLQHLVLDLVGRTGEDALLAEVTDKFPTAAFAALELDIAHWADCAPGCARLVHFARPRDLDPALGPDEGR